MGVVQAGRIGYFGSGLANHDLTSLVRICNPGPEKRGICNPRSQPNVITDSDYKSEYV